MNRSRVLFALTKTTDEVGVAEMMRISSSERKKMSRKIRLKADMKTAMVAGSEPDELRITGPADATATHCLLLQ